MSKDPAFMFYSSDFLTGCSDLTMEERGFYITLMCLQHQKGRLSKKTIWLSLGFSLVFKFEDFVIEEKVPVDVLKKFQIDEVGNFYNERLEEEIEKRIAFTNSRKANGSKGGRPPKAKGNHNQNHMVNSSLSYEEPKNNLHEDENEDENINKDNNSLNKNSEIFSKNPVLKKFDPYDYAGNEKYFEIYKNECSKLIPLKYERRDGKTLTAISEFRGVINDDLGYFLQVCKKANDLVIIADNKLDFRSVLNNHIGIFGDKYKKAINEKEGETTNGRSGSNKHSYTQSEGNSNQGSRKGSGWTLNPDE